MSIYKLSDIYIYPIKSLGGISVDKAEVTDRGLKYDRRWMLVDEGDNFLTQRTHTQMALLQVSIQANQLLVSHKHDSNNAITIPMEPNQFVGEVTQAKVWDDNVQVKVYNHHVNEWFSRQLGFKCKLVYMPDSTQRKVDTEFAEKGEITSLSDCYPFLIIGQESLNLLNQKLDKSISIDRFRPNFVFEGGKAHDEDNWRKFKIGDVTFYGVKLCSRCVVTTIDQQTAEKNQEPLRTLLAYRNFDGKIMFGMNLIHEKNGIVKVNDTLVVQ